MSSSILILFLIGDEVQELAPAASRVGLALQYRQEWPTSPFFCRGAPIDIVDVDMPARHQDVDVDLIFVWFDRDSINIFLI